jgi:hypothetical protein
LEQVIQTNAASAEEMDAASRDFASQAERLLEAASFFSVPESLKIALEMPAESDSRKLTLDLEDMSEADREILNKYLRPLDRKRGGKSAEDGEKGRAKMSDRIRDRKKREHLSEKENIFIDNKEDLDDTAFEIY